MSTTLSAVGQLRHRTGTQSGPAAISCAVIVAVVAALLGACLGAWAAWHTAPRLPDRKVTDGIVGSAFAGSGMKPYGLVYGYPFSFGAPCDGGKGLNCSIAGFLFGGEYGYFHESRTYALNLPDTKAGALLATASRQLSAAGWKIAPKTGLTPKFYGYTATKDDLVANVIAGILDGPTRFVEVDFEGDRSTDPILVAPATAIGLIAGAVAGWLLAAWTIRRRKALSRDARILSSVGFALVVAMFIPAGVAIVLELRKYVFAHEPNLPIWQAIVEGIPRFLLIAGIIPAAALLVAIAVAGLRAERKAAPDS
jgi:hypothetical protein